MIFTNCPRKIFKKINGKLTKMPLKLFEVNLNELINRERYLCGCTSESDEIFWMVLEYDKSKMWTDECQSYTVDTFFCKKKDKYLIFELP
jgi:hypothetical protein